jgi:hypothetical protein
MAEMDTLGQSVRLCVVSEKKSAGTGTPGVVTVTVLEDAIPREAVITAVPDPTAVTTPLLLTIATEGAEEVQLTCDVTV